MAGRQLADGGFTPRSVASRTPAPVHRPASGNPGTRNLADSYKPPGPSRAYQAAVTKVPSRGGAPSAYKPPSIQNAATQALMAGGIGAAQGAAAPAAPAYIPPPPPQQVFSGSGRSRGYVGGQGTGTEAAMAPAATFVPPAVAQAPTAAVMPPPEVNPAGPGAGNVAGESFDKVGAGSGTFGQEQRRRQARGPMTGLSVTPEMLRRAATQRIG